MTATIIWCWKAEDDYDLLFTTLYLDKGRSIRGGFCGILGDMVKYVLEKGVLCVLDREEETDTEKDT